MMKEAHTALSQYREEMAAAEEQEKQEEQEGDERQEGDGEEEKENEEQEEEEECTEAGTVQIFVKIPHLAKTITLDTEPCDTIRCIKAMISAQESIPRAVQRLIFADEQLEDDNTLLSYGIKEGSSITLAPLSKKIFKDPGK